MEISTPVRVLPSPATSNFRMVWSRENSREKVKPKTQVLSCLIIHLGPDKVHSHQLISSSELTSNLPRWHHWPLWRGRCCQGWRGTRLSSLCSATHPDGCIRCPGWHCRPLEHMEVDFCLSSTCIDQFSSLQMTQLKLINFSLARKWRRMKVLFVVLMGQAAGVGGRADLYCCLHKPSEYAVLFVWHRLETCHLPKVQGKNTKPSPE